MSGSLHHGFEHSVCRVVCENSILIQVREKRRNGTFCVKWGIMWRRKYVYRKRQFYGHVAANAGLVRGVRVDAGDPGATDPVERQSSRPDVGILCYPVITMGPNTHQGSKNNLLGSETSAELIKLLSNELQVTPQTPPSFLWHTWEDKAVKVENSLEFAVALQKAGVPFDLHVYQQGRHGIGLANGHPWTKDCVFWLKAQGFIR